jgi:hypothetical protein
VVIQFSNQVNDELEVIVFTMSPSAAIVTKARPVIAVEWHGLRCIAGRDGFAILANPIR